MDPGKPDFHSEKVAFQTALMVGDLKMVHDLMRQEWQLFDRGADPSELAPQSSDHPRFRQLQGQLWRWERSRKERVGEARHVPAAEELKRLQSLGYLR